MREPSSETASAQATTTPSSSAEVARPARSPNSSACSDCVLEDRFQLSLNIPAEQRPVVFIGPFEHHSNELPWRESIADVVTVREDADGHVDLADLETRLQQIGDPFLPKDEMAMQFNLPQHQEP